MDNKRILELAGVQLNEAIGGHDEKARTEKIQSVNFYQAEKLIFEWVKTGVINVREFSNLCDVNWDKKT